MRAGHTGEASALRCGRTRVRVRLRLSAAVGMTSGPRLSAAAGAGERGDGLAALLGRDALLGCGASEPSRIVVGARADFWLLGYEQKMGQKRGMLRGRTKGV
jgi:hypothetical protein